MNADSEISSWILSDSITTRRSAMIWK